MEAPLPTALGAGRSAGRKRNEDPKQVGEGGEAGEGGRAHEVRKGAPQVPTLQARPRGHLPFCPFLFYLFFTEMLLSFFN